MCNTIATNGITITAKGIVETFSYNNRALLLLTGSDRCLIPDVELLVTTVVISQGEFVSL